TPSVITVTAMIVSMALLAWAMKSLPVGTAYAVWTDIQGAIAFFLQAHHLTGRIQSGNGNPTGGNIFVIGMEQRLTV
ncbi:SMR family transporter, partial [Escherichia coli]|uniref:SMR family transporter n=1 Tax=Escherichia coli TaxID=562 RepID=UPI003EDF85BC